MTLFREEVIRARTDRLYGDVVLSLPWANHLLALLLISVAAATILWFSFGTYARVERAEGILVTESPVAKIYAPRNGVASMLYVEDGALVHKDDPLVMVDLDVRNKDGAATMAASREAVEDQLRLAQSQITLAHQAFDMEQNRLRFSLASSKHQVAVLAEQLEAQNQIVLSQQQVFDRIGKVVEQGYVSQQDYEKQKQSLLASRQSQLLIQRQLIDLRSEISTLTAQLHSIQVTRSREVAALESEVSAFRQRNIETSSAQAILIKAPIAGKVTAVQIGVGQNVRTEIPLMLVVPEGADLRAEIYAPTRAIGLVRVGQETRIQFDAFPYQRFGTSRGRVTSVSSVILDPRETTAPFALKEPVYKVTITLDSQFMEARGEKLPLQPGMTLSANIVLERQNFLEWLLRPLHAVVKRNE